MEDETWVQHSEPKLKWQFMQWHNPKSSRKKKCKSVPSAGKIMVTVFWDEKGVIFVNILHREARMNSDCHVEALRNL
jgi:hypothetical protein